MKSISIKKTDTQTKTQNSNIQIEDYSFKEDNINKITLSGDIKNDNLNNVPSQRIIIFSTRKISTQENQNSKKSNNLQNKDKIPDFNTLSKEEKKIRIGFIRKVYGILTFQLILSIGILSLSFITKVKNFTKASNHLFIAYISASLIFIMLIIMSCFKTASRRIPLNYIILFLWTICEGYVLLTLSSFFSQEIVLMALGLTTGLSIGITIYALINQKDFTFIGGFLSGFIFIIVLVIMFGFIYNRWLNTIYCGLGVIIFSLYLVYDTQLLLGKFRIRYEIDDYIIAALNLYVDIINIFILLLTLLGMCHKK